MHHGTETKTTVRHTVSLSRADIVELLVDKGLIKRAGPGDLGVAVDIGLEDYDRYDDRLDDGRLVVTWEETK
jgi:hypothetical protein